jgi:hypothetical protein
LTIASACLDEAEDSALSVVTLGAVPLVCELATMTGTMSAKRYFLVRLITSPAEFVIALLNEWYRGRLRLAGRHCQLSPPSIAASLASVTSNMTGFRGSPTETGQVTGAGAAPRGWAHSGSHGDLPGCRTLVLCLEVLATVWPPPVPRTRVRATKPGDASNRLLGTGWGGYAPGGVGKDRFFTCG